MKKHEVHVLSKIGGFSGMKDDLSKEVERFLNAKASAGYEIISVSFSYVDARELVAFVTICK